MKNIEQINNELKELGITKSQVAKDTGLTKGWVSNFLNGKQSSNVGLVMLNLYLKLKRIEKNVSE